MSLNKEVRECLNDEEGLKNAINYVANIFLSKMGTVLNVKVTSNSPPRRALNKKRK